MGPVLDLDPVFRPSGTVGPVTPLGDHALLMSFKVLDTLGDLLAFGRTEIEG
jgi:hypothetical protein